MKIQLRRGTSGVWASDNPVLAPGEPGWDSSGHVLRIGDGVTPWSGLPSVGGTGTGTAGITAALGVSALSVDPQVCAVAAALSAGTHVCVLVSLPGGALTTLGCWLHTAGVTPSGYNGLALYTAAGVLVAATADTPALFTTGPDSWNSALAALGSPASGAYYLSALAHFSGGDPTLAATNAIGALPAINGRFPSVFTTGVATFPASFNPATYTRNTGYYCLTAS